MSKELKCPFCGTRMTKIAGELYDSFGCQNDECHYKYGWISEAVWQALIQYQKDLEESQQATLQNAQTVLEIHKDLEVATQALEKLKYEYNRCRDEEFEGEDIDWEWWAMAAKNVVENALEQIEHKE